MNPTTPSPLQPEASTPTTEAQQTVSQPQMQPNTGVVSPQPMATPSPNNNSASTLSIVAIILAFLAPVIGLILGIISLHKAQTNQTKTGLAKLAIIFSIIMIPVGFFIAVRLVSNSVQVNMTSEYTPVITADKPSTTLLSIDDATKKIQTFGDKLTGNITSGDFVSAYNLASPEFKQTTSSAQANDVFLEIETYFKQSGFTLLKVNCFPVTGANALKSGALCGGLYGNKDTRADNTYDYVLLVLNGDFTKMHYIGNQQLGGLGNDKKSVDDEANDILFEKVKSIYEIL